MVIKILIDLGLFQILNITNSVWTCAIIKLLSVIFLDLIFGKIFDQNIVIYFLTCTIMGILYYFSFWLLQKTSGTFWYYIVALLIIILI